MTLREWVNSHIPSQRRPMREYIAKALGCSEVAVRHWMNRKRGTPGKYCIRIEELTQGHVTRYELRPDIFGQPPPDGCRRRGTGLRPIVA